MRTHCDDISVAYAAAITPQSSQFVCGVQKWSTVFNFRSVSTCCANRCSSWQLFDDVGCYRLMRPQTVNVTRKPCYRKDDRAMRPIYTVSQKNCANLFFAPCLSNMNQIQWKLEGLSRKKPLTKLYLNCLLHLKYVLALPWEIWSVRLSRQRNN